VPAAEPDNIWSGRPWEKDTRLLFSFADLTNIHSLNFDIPNRHLTVYHTGDSDEVYQRHDRLKLDTSVVDTISADHGVLPDLIPDERKLLWSVLAMPRSFEDSETREMITSVK
jgi:hypothetical protein